MSEALKALQPQDEGKYRLLNEFYSRLKEGTILPQAEDIRQFAQIVGLKEISGKARRDMLPSLMWFLIDQPAERVRDDVTRAEAVSEKQRQKGFSILTDKLLRN
ncbi:hypothetical protein [Longimicrobium terrae]|uniref:Uncharacterized protein n=1 Tax=Longimicrobium terrae TaxID=1639882 RepID=A0A841GYF0_9BACT|nr:hypothetical protein [Longimicrobium terrae]MBB4636362.1 hypothetical protein [Longimicrobium terrae]MBB6070758.1 hypothetical protein [Longimicrobium terrae]NNC29738.1 hypothetical protein [Longimicrobium terrae]